MPSAREPNLRPIVEFAYITGNLAPVAEVVRCAQSRINVMLRNVAELKRGVQSDRATERELAFAWQQASSAFYGLDGRLAERLQLKGEYWTQPESWTDAQVRDANISLQHVAEHARQLLHESKL